MSVGKTIIRLVTCFGIATAFILSAAAADKGSKEEAQATADRAAALLADDGLPKGLDKINKSGEFRDRDLYVFAMDRGGHIIAHAANPALVGVDISGLRDPDGIIPARENWNAADAHPSGSWVFYKTVNPTNKKIEKKQVWVEKVGDVLVGVGGYAEEQ